MASKGTVARGNRTALEYEKNGRTPRSVLKSSEKVAKAELKGLEGRLKNVREQVKRVEERLNELTGRSLEDMDPEATQANKQRIDQAVKLLAAWDKVGRACRIELGIVTVRTLAAETQKEKAKAENGFDKAMREFQGD